MPIHFRNSPVNEPFILDSIGNHWSQDRVLRPKGYPLYHYLHTEKGQGVIDAQGKTYTLNEGEGILIAPYLHHTYGKNTETWMTSFVTFTGTIDSSISKIVGDRQIIFVEKEQGALISALIDSIMDDWNILAADNRALSIRCYCLLMHFADSIHTRSLSGEPLYVQYVEPVIKEIETHFDSTELTASGLSEQVFITPQYLSRLFRRFLGRSVYEYLTAYRINRARELLVSNPRMEVQQIAGLTGFSDTSHFIAMFRKVTGVTPLEFRRLN